MDSRVDELNDMMQERFGFYVNDEYRSKPVTNETLTFAMQQMICAFAVGLAEIEKRLTTTSE